MSRLLALNGSPHRTGNTATLMSWILEGSLEAGASAKWLHLVEADLSYCRGCMRCLREGRCAINDGFLEILEDLTAADAIIVGCPQYAGGPTAQLKTLMDRLTLLNLYTDTFAGHWSVGVVTSGLAPNLGLARSLSGFFGRSFAVLEARTATVAAGYRSLDDTASPALRQRAQQVGRELVGAIRSGAVPRPRGGFSGRLQDHWIKVLRRVFLDPMMQHNPEPFQAALSLRRSSAEWARKRELEGSS